MKMLMIVVDEAKKEELEVLLNDLSEAGAGVDGYTEIPRVLGVGHTGPRLGSRAFPRTSAVIFTVVAADRLPGIRERIEACCGPQLAGAHLVAWDVESMVGGT
jgi:hypothetical protein